MFSPPILGFAAASGTGKTSLLTKLIPLLNIQGLQIGVVKHSHHDFEIDHPGKDSFRLRKAGASPVMLVSRHRRAIISELSYDHEVSLSEHLAAFPKSGIDLVLVEGFRHELYPKIELHRPSLGNPPIYPNDSSIIAVASDQFIATPAGLTCLDLNDATAIAKFIVENFMKAQRD